MKKLICFVILILAMWLCALRADAPPYECFPVVSTEGINPYKQIWFAVCMEESRMDRYAFNYKEEARGISQIRPVRLREYNKETGSNYTLTDLYDVGVSKEIFMYYAEKIGHHNPNLIIRKWNGSGPMTYKYLKRVKKHLTNS